MIDQDEARTRVLRVLDADCEESVGAKRRTLIADKIITALYAPRARLREVVAPSGNIFRFVAGFLESHEDDEIHPPRWIRCAQCVEVQDCAVVADLLSRPTEAVPSEESVVTADALDAKRYRAWRALTLSAAPKQTPQQLDEAVDEMMAQQGAPS